MEKVLTQEYIVLERKRKKNTSFSENYKLHFQLLAYSTPKQNTTLFNHFSFHHR